MDAISDVRPSPIAGRWYPGSQDQLARQVDRYLFEAIIPPITGNVIAVIAPHAGHRYSGRTAARAYKTVEGQTFDLVVIASPFHGYHPAALLTSAHKSYTTPLGTVEIDRQAVTLLNSSLEKGKNNRLEPVAYDEEHSIEIQIPFLQRALEGKFSLLPIMVRTLDFKLIHSLGNALAESLRGRSCLLVGSTDLSHFYPKDKASEFDHEMLKRMSSLKPEEIVFAEKHALGFACGAGAVVAVIQAALDLGANHAEILDYSTSADETGDSTSVVGYGAIVVTRKE